MLAMRVAMVQFAPVFGEVQENLKAIESACAGLSADLVVLPELCTTGYQFRDRRELLQLAEPAGGPSLRRLSGAAAACGGHLVAGFAEKEADLAFNSAALVGPEGVLGVYRKVHLFSEEKRLFEQGDRGFPVFRVGGVPVGMMICFDWIFPESARSLSLGGAWVIAHCANLVLPFCQDALITRALENRVFILSCNRTGEEERIAGQKYVFTGRSRMVAPDGAVIEEGSPDAPAVVVAEIDPARASDKKLTALNHIIRDRRTDQYRL
jgi:predicted amidohydrolase